MSIFLPPPLGNVKQRDIITLKGDVHCNLTGFCDCGWAMNQRVELLNAQNEPYERSTLYEYESNLLELLLPEEEETKEIIYSIDRLEEDAQIVKNLRIKGRVFLDGTSKQQLRCFVVLKSTKKTYIFDTRKAPAFETVRPDDPGFFAFIPKGTLEGGDYSIGIYMNDIHTGRGALQYTERHVVIDRRSGFSIVN